MMRAAFLAFQNFEHPSTRLNHETFEQEEARTRSTSPHRANACWALADIAMEPAWRQAIGKHEEILNHLVQMLTEGDLWEKKNAALCCGNLCCDRSGRIFLDVMLSPLGPAWMLQNSL